MGKLYLLTGASGHLGSTVLDLLLKRKEKVRVLVLPGEEKYIPAGVEIVIGDVLDPASLIPFFQNDDADELILLHCAGIVTISSRKDPLVYEVNVNGTHNILKAAKEYGVKVMVYVSSVHALVEAESGATVETDHFEAEKIKDQYGISKAMASGLCLQFAQEGLDVRIVHPSGIYGPGDKRKTNHSVRSIELMAKGLIPAAFKGGFDFVDVRDAAQGILLTSEYGRKGECYILSGHYSEVRDLLRHVNDLLGRKTPGLMVPYALVRGIAPLAESGSRLLGIKKPLITPYSIEILHGNGHFSHEKATRELGYQPRDLDESLRDMLIEFRSS